MKVDQNTFEVDSVIVNRVGYFILHMLDGSSWSSIVFSWFFYICYEVLVLVIALIFYVLLERLVIKVYEMFCRFFNIKRKRKRKETCLSLRDVSKVNYDKSSGVLNIFLKKSKEENENIDEAGDDRTDKGSEVKEGGKDDIQ